MIELLEKYWLEAVIVGGILLILSPTILAPVVARVKKLFGKVVGQQDECLSDLDKVLKLQKRYPSAADQLESVAMTILKYHREH